jgi:hypothetical protein
MTYSPPSSSRPAAPINTRTDRLALPVGVTVSGAPSVATTNGAIATGRAVAVAGAAATRFVGARVFTCVDRVAARAAGPTIAAASNAVAAGRTVGAVVAPGFSVPIGLALAAVAGGRGVTVQPCATIGVVEGMSHGSGTVGRTLVGVGIGEDVAVRVGVAVRVAVDCCTPPVVAVTVAVGVRVGVRVIVGVGVGVGVPATTEADEMGVLEVLLLTSTN